MNNVSFHISRAPQGYQSFSFQKKKKIISNKFDKIILNKELNEVTSKSDSLFPHEKFPYGWFFLAMLERRNLVFQLLLEI